MSDDLQAKELAKRLGIKKGCSLAIMNPPYGLVKVLETIRENLRSMQTEIKMNESNDLDVVVYFSRGRRGLEEAFPRLKGQLAPGGVLWIGWRKPQKTLKTDLDAGGVREIAAMHGMSGKDELDVDSEWQMMKLAAGGEHS
ncbi:MAG: hypothetical protein A4E28_03238 [Methanocella sp. PtaU1.Bin125]|nr:MAG: hypothetical protein A4E28_03238 [Methanocella sp. PtaU1.Bin125]